MHFLTPCPFILLFLFIFCFRCFSCVSAFSSASRPLLGWSTWNTFGCHYTADDLIQVAIALQKTGLQSLGYSLLAIDDCWSSGRNSSGYLVPSARVFPSGIEPFIEQLKSLNFSVGIYSSAGPLTCAGFAGSLGYEYQDAEQWLQWGIQYLKYDACHIETQQQRQHAYKTMGDALQRAIQSSGSLSLSSSIYMNCATSELIRHAGNEEYPSYWGPSTRICNSARVGWDIEDTWSSTVSLIDSVVNLQFLAGSNTQYWNDLDSLTVGQGNQNIEQYKTQMAFWALTGSPLMLGMDVRAADAESLAIVGNPRVIAVSQDQLGKPGNLVKRTIDGTIEVWSRPIKAKTSSVKPDQYSSTSCENIFAPVPYTRFAVIIWNRLATIQQNITLEFSDLYENFLNPHPKSPVWRVQIHDIWSDAEYGMWEERFIIPQILPYQSVFLDIQLQL